MQLQCKVNDINSMVYDGHEGHTLTNWVVKVELESAKESSLCNMDGSHLLDGESLLKHPKSCGSL